MSAAAPTPGAPYPWAGTPNASFPGEPLIEVRNLKMYFPIRGGVAGRTVGFVRAVDGVELTIRAGQTLGLIGESGCGKTTVGRCLLRLLEPTDGQVLFRGLSLTDLPKGEIRALRRDMQIIFQDPFGSLNPRMLVSTIVSEGLRAFKGGIADRYPQEVQEAGGRLDELQIAKITANLMARVGLNPEHLNRFPHEFSGGQRQRICVARALALKPKFVVLDEPTSALDVSVQAQILNLLKELQRENQLTYLFISHHLSVIRHMCDEVAVMYLGKIVERAPNESLFSLPLHPYTIALMSAIPSVDPELRRERILLEGDVPSAANPPPGCRFHTRCPFGTERQTLEVEPKPFPGEPGALFIDDPLVVPRTVRLVVAGEEIHPLAVEGTVAYEADEAVANEGEADERPGAIIRVRITFPPAASLRVRYRRYRAACVTKEPPLSPAEPGHLVACHFHGEVRQAHDLAEKTDHSVAWAVAQQNAPLPPTPE